MKSPNHYQPTMQTEEILELVATEMSDTLSSGESRRLAQWRSESPDNERLYRRLVAVWQSTPGVADLAIYDPEKAFRRFCERIGHEVAASASVPGGEGSPSEEQQESTAKHTGLQTRLTRYLAYAATVALIAGIFSAAAYMIGRHRMEQSFAQITVEAPQGSMSKTTLPDGTQVWLNAGSRIAYSQGFGVSDRRVSITGEGYFEVRHNEAMPFSVSSANIKVRVLGTKFDFRDYPSDASAMVSLDEGSVALSVGGSDDAGSEYQLKPNQRAVFEKRSGRLSIENSNDGTARLWVDGTIMLNGRRMADIALDLQRMYDMRIVIADTALENMRFYGVFHRKNQSLTQILNTLAGTGRIRYRIRGNEVKIY